MLEIKSIESRLFTIALVLTAEWSKFPRKMNKWISQKISNLYKLNKHFSEKYAFISQLLIKFFFFIESDCTLLSSKYHIKTVPKNGKKIVKNGSRLKKNCFIDKIDFSCFLYFRYVTWNVSNWLMLFFNDRRML